MPGHATHTGPVTATEHPGTPDGHPDVWVLCAEHDGPWRLPAGPYARCGRHANKLWHMCGQCAWTAGVCAASETPVPAERLNTARLFHEQPLGHACSGL